MGKLSPTTIAAIVLLVVAALGIGLQVVDWSPKPNPYPVILAGLQSSDPAVRFNAIENLGNLGAGADMIPHLLKAVKDDPEYGVRHAAADALARSPTDMTAFSGELFNLMSAERDPQIRELLKFVVDNKAGP